MLNSSRALQHTLVDEDQALGSDAVLILDPLPPSASNVRPVALAGDDAFF